MTRASSTMMSSFKAQKLRPWSLEHNQLSDLCEAFVNGNCQDQECQSLHEIRFIDEYSTTSVPTLLGTSPNYLSLEPRRRPSNEHVFDDDGPGHFSKLGPRHDNDHVEVQDIRILPTTDEVSLKIPSWLGHAHIRLSLDSLSQTLLYANK